MQFVGIYLFYYLSLFHYLALFSDSVSFKLQYSESLYLIFVLFQNYTFVHFLTV